MGLTFIDTEVTIAGEALNTFSAADRFTLPTAWSPAVIRWGGSDSLDPPTPAVLSLRVTIPDGYRIPEWGDAITVSTVTDATGGGDGGRLRVFTGRIDEAARRRTTLRNERTGGESEVWQLDLSASDELAALGRIQLSDVPWPEESSAARWQRIRDLLAARGVSIDASGDNEPVRARDVDSFSAMEALRLTSAHTGATLATDEGVIFAARYSTMRHLVIDAAEVAWIEDEVDPTVLPAAILEDQDRTLGVGGILSAVTINHPTPDPDNPGDYTDRRTQVRARSTEDTYGPGGYTIETDLLGNLTPALDRAHRLLGARAAAQWRLPTTRVLLDQYDGYAFQITDVIKEPTRHRAPVKIAGGPPDLDPYHRVIGGTLTLHGDPTQQALEITTEPASFAGPDSVRIAELTEFPISSLVNVTIADLGTVSDAVRIN